MGEDAVPPVEEFRRVAFCVDGVVAGTVACRDYLSHHQPSVSHARRSRSVSRHTTRPQNTDGHRHPTQRLLNHLLHPRVRPLVQPRPQQAPLPAPLRDGIPGPKDGAKVEWRRVAQGRVEVVARGQVRLVVAFAFVG